MSAVADCDSDVVYWSAMLACVESCWMFPLEHMTTKEESVL